MDWVQLAIPLIAVAVWILSNLANQQKETRQQPRTPLPPPRPRDPLDPMAAGRQTRPEDDNKYREEMERKREKKSPQAKPIPRPRPRPKRYEAAPKPPPLPAILVNPQPPPRTDAQVEPILKVGVAAAPIVKPTPAALKNMRELLKRPESLATAFLLKEVLDLPVSKRPRRRK